VAAHRSCPRRDEDQQREVDVSADQADSGASPRAAHAADSKGASAVDDKVVLSFDLARRRALITLDRGGHGNALDAAMVAAIAHAVESCSRSEDIDTIVLHGRGRNFCTGFDWSGTEDASDGDLLLRFVDIELMLAALWSAPKRTVAAVQGRAWGAGADLVVACDVRIAEDAASFRFPGAGFGLVLGSRRLAERVGVATARRIVTTGESLDAAAAQDIGLLTSIVPAGLATDGTLDDAALDRVLAPMAVDAHTLAGLVRATRPAQDDADLANLVRSAARPGLVARLRRYRESVRRR
jgi:enoyl-CoA hydratase/carnithine racemase